MHKLMTKEEIAKELLKPYFDDPSICGISEDGHNCVYNGPDGKMCVFARACTPEGRKMLSEQYGVYNSLDRLGYEILQEKYRHIRDEWFWSMVQRAHDELSTDEGTTAYKLYAGLTGEYYHGDQRPLHTNSESN